LKPSGENESFFCADTPINRSLTVVEVSKNQMGIQKPNQNKIYKN